MTEKWGESYAHKAAVFADTDYWKKEAAQTLRYLPFTPVIGASKVKVLDLGCNMGAWVEKALVECDFLEIHAMDVNTYAVEALASKNLPNVHTHTSLETIPEELDYVVMMHVINQIEDLESTMAEVWRKMRSGGVLVVVTHNPIPSKFRWLSNKIKGYKSDATMVREPHLGELNQLMYDNGFKLYDSYYFGEHFIPFLKRRSIYVGTKP